MCHFNLIEIYREHARAPSPNFSTVFDYVVIGRLLLCLLDCLFKTLETNLPFV